MRLPNAAHESRPWRIREIVPDFTLEDVWALPVHGGAEDFQTLLELMASSDPANAESLPTRVLWRVRDRLGSWFGLGRISAPIDSDRDDAAGKLPIPGTNETSLTDRLPDDLRNTAADLDFGSLPFVAPLSHRRRVCRGDVEPDRARRDAPGLGRSGRRPLPRTDGRLRQATRSVREGIHGAHQAVPALGRLPGTHATDRANVEYTRSSVGRAPLTGPPRTLGAFSEGRANIEATRGNRTLIVATTTRSSTVELWPPCCRLEPT